MIVRNRVIALIFRIAAFALLVTSIQLYWPEYPSFWCAMSCFDFQVGMSLTIMFGFVIVFNLIDLRFGMRGMAAGPYMPLALPLMSFSIVAGVMYFSYSIPTASAPVGIFPSIFHSLMIVLPLLEWLLFDEKGTVRRSTGFTIMIYPLFYYVFGYFRTLIWPDTPVYAAFEYAYPCLDFRTDMIVLWSFVYFGSLLAFLQLMIFLNDVFCGKYRSR